MWSYAIPHQEGGSANSSCTIRSPLYFIVYVPYKYVDMGLSSTRGILKLDSRSTKEEEEDRGEGPLPLGLPYTIPQALQ